MGMALSRLIRKLFLFIVMKAHPRMVTVDGRGSGG